MMPGLPPQKLTLRAAVLDGASVLARRLDDQDAAYRAGGEAGVRASVDFEIDQAHVDELWRQTGTYDGDRDADLLRARIAVSGAELLARRVPGAEQIGRLLEALELARRHGERMTEGKLLLRLGNAYYHTSGPRCDLYDQALAIAREIDDAAFLYDALINRGVCANAQRDMKTARDYYEQALAQAERSLTSYAVPRALGVLGNVLREEGDLTGAERTLLEAIAAMERGGVPAGVRCDTFRFMGLLRLRENRLDDAVTWFECQLQVAEDARDRRIISSALNSLGTVDYRREDLEGAARRFERAADLACQLGNLRLQAQSVGNLGAAYLAQGELAKAFAQHEKALALFRHFGDPRGVAEELVNGAKIHQRLDQVPEAVSLARQALSIQEAGPEVVEAAQRVIEALAPS